MFLCQLDVCWCITCSIMYSIKVEHATEGRPGPSPSLPSKQGPGDAEASGVACDVDAASVPDSVEFSSGNPRVEHLTGVVRLYRHVQALTPPAPPWNSGSGACPEPPVRGRRGMRCHGLHACWRCARTG